MDELRKALRLHQVQEISAAQDNGRGTQPVMVRAFFTDLYYTRQIDPRGMWRLDVFTGNSSANMRLVFTREQRQQLVEALGGIVPEWTQEDEDAYITRKSDRDWHLALKPEDV